MLFRSPVPNQTTITETDKASYPWLEWFRQVRGILNELNYSRDYGGFNQTTDQTPTAINTAQVVPFSHYLQDGVSIVDGSKITIKRTGLYKIDFSTQITSTSSSIKNVWFWPRVNGVDVGGFTMKHTLSSNNETEVVSRHGIFSLSANDYLQVMWAADSTNVKLGAVAATAFSPASPAALLAVIQLR